MCEFFVKSQVFMVILYKRRGAKFVLSNQIVINKLFVNILSYVHNSVVKALQRVKNMLQSIKRKL